MNYLVILKLSCFISMTKFVNIEAQSSTDATTSETISAMPLVKNDNEEKEVFEAVKENPSMDDVTKKTDQETKGK